MAVNDALLCLCFFTLHANNALVRKTGGVVSVVSSAFTIVLAGVFLEYLKTKRGRGTKSPCTVFPQTFCERRLGPVFGS